MTRVDLERTSSEGSKRIEKMVQNERRHELKDIRVEWGGQPPRKFLPPLRFGRRRLVPHSSEP